jgi:hypothetical protein
MPGPKPHPAAIRRNRGRKRGRAATRKPNIPADGVAAGTGIALAGGSLNAITVVSDGTNWWII